MDQLNTANQNAAEYESAVTVLIWPYSLEGETEETRQLFRFGCFDLKRFRYLGLKPGVTAEEINPGWRNEALKFGLLAYAVDVSSHCRKGPRARRVAEVLTELSVAGAFSRPTVRLDETGNVLVECGTLWYLSDAEREESLQLTFATIDAADFPEQPGVLEALDAGWNLIDQVVTGMSNVQEPGELNYLKKVSIEAIVEQQQFVDNPRYREALKVLITSDRFSRKRTLTPDLSTEANTLYGERHARLRAAAKDYTVHKRRHTTDWAKYVARDDKERPGKPKIPSEFISQLPLKAQRELALEWTAAELNRRHKSLSATANTVRTLLKRAKAGIK